MKGIPDKEQSSSCGILAEAVANIMKAAKNIAVASTQIGDNLAQADQLPFQLAKEQSIEKWEGIKEKLLAIRGDFSSNCGFCDRYKREVHPIGSGCRHICEASYICEYIETTHITLAIQHVNWIIASLKSLELKRKGGECKK